MKSPKAALTDLGRAANPGEAIESLQARHGRSTTRFIAEQLGVSMRTVQRWRKGTQTPRDAGRVTGMADPEQVRINALRNASTVSVGSVTVFSKSSGTMDGKRNVGTLPADLNFAADLLEDGASEAEVQAAMSDFVLDAYSSRDGGNLGDVLSVGEYGSFEVT